MKLTECSPRRDAFCPASLSSGQCVVAQPRSTGYLIQYPCILPAFTKEIHYFGRTSSFNRGTYWYKSHFPRASQVAQVQKNSPAKYYPN